MCKGSSFSIQIKTSLLGQRNVCRNQLPLLKSRGKTLSGKRTVNRQGDPPNLDGSLNRSLGTTNGHHKLPFMSMGLLKTLLYNYSSSREAGLFPLSNTRLAAIYVTAGSVLTLHVCRFTNTKWGGAYKTFTGQ